MTPRDIVVYVFLALAWGLSFLVLLEVVHGFGWVGAVTFRSLVAGTTLLVVAGVTRRRLELRIPWGRVAVVGATTVAGQLIGLSYATPLIGTAMAAIIVATIPLFAMLISQAWGVERMTGRGRLGLVLGFIGIVLLVGFPAVPFTWTFVVGCIVCMLSCASAAFGSVYASRHLRKVGSWEVTIGAFLSGAVLTAPFLAVVPVPGPPPTRAYVYLLIAGSLMSAMTYALYFRLVAAIGPTRAISVEFAVTVVAVVVGALILREPLGLAQLGGAAVIVTGCALVLGLIPRKGGTGTNGQASTDR